MNEKTVLQLNTLNTHFYHTVADEFVQTRQQAWAGWSEVLPIILKMMNSLQPNEALRVLDFGCGHGRFYHFLEQHLPHQLWKYKGIDNSTKLLQLAQQHYPKAEWQQQDIVETLLTDQLKTLCQSSAPQLITAFGVLHHIPSFALRKKFIKTIASVLPKHGVFIGTAWQFQELPNIINRSVAPERVKLNPDDLEANDYLLTWERGKFAVRYCHLVATTEVEQLFHPLFPSLQTFCADGKNNCTNLYIVAKPV